jgi:predicted permease
MLALEPHLGRFLTEDDERPGAPGAIVLSYDFWQRHFGGDPGAIGETILVEAYPATVIGVTPPGYKGIHADSGFGFSISMMFLTRVNSPDPRRPIRGLNAVGRLAPGVSIDQARAATATAWPRIRAEAIQPGLPPAELADAPTQGMRLDSLAGGVSSLRRQYREPLLVVMAMAAALLLIACVNISGLLLARTAGRARQAAIALAIGASRARLGRQLFLEALLPAVAGAIGGLALAAWLTGIAAGVLWRGSSPLERSLAPDAWVVGFTSGIAVLVALGVSVLPAWTIGRTRAAELLWSGRTATPGHRGLTRALLTLQTGLSLVLLAGAGLLATSLLNLRNVDLGVDTGGLRFTRFFAVPGGYQQLDAAAYYPDLVSRLEAVPGVASVALAGIFPSFYGLDLPVTTYPVAGAGGGEPVDAFLERVTPRFFDTVGIRRIAGRDFTWSDDTAQAPVAIVNETLARRVFGDRDPLGQRLQIGAGAAAAAVDVVGVVADAAIVRYKEPHAPQIFRPRMQELAFARAPLVLFRTSGPPEAADAGIRQVAADFGHEYSRGFLSVDQQIDRALVRERLLAGLAWFFAATAALLSFIGLYAALAFAVARRTREIGVRLAIGAPRAAIIRLIVGESLGVTLAGVVIGVAGTIAGGRLVAGWLFGVSASDPGVLAAAAISFLAIGAGAAVRPARRAASVDPVGALRSE